MWFGYLMQDSNYKITHFTTNIYINCDWLLLLLHRSIICSPPLIICDIRMVIKKKMCTPVLDFFSLRGLDCQLLLAIDLVSLYHIGNPSTPWKLVTNPSQNFVFNKSILIGFNFFFLLLLFFIVFFVIIIEM